jgi:hypothetical protein
MGLIVSFTVFIIYFASILGGSLVTTAWHILRLRMKETVSSYGWQLGIH